MNDWERILASVLRMPRAITAALLAAWTAVVLALWTAIAGALLAVCILFIKALFGGIASDVVFNVSTAGGVTFLTIFAALATGAVGGFTAAYSGAFIGHEAEVASSLLLGSFLAAVISYVALSQEYRILRLRGYRRPSRREWDESIRPALESVAESTGSDTMPYVLISDTPAPQAWTHGTTVVLTKGIMEGLEPDELTAVFAHEFCHWRMGDGIAMRMVWAMCWPLAILYNAGMFLSGARFGENAATTMQGGREALAKAKPYFIAVVAWLFLWPTAFLIRLVIAPISAADCRRLEYDADAGVAAMGMGAALVKALEALPPFEAGRTAWEAALTRTHPPIELRIERLEAIMATSSRDSKRDQPAMSRALIPAQPHKQAVRIVLGIAAFLLLVSLSPLWTSIGNKSSGSNSPAAVAARTPSAPSPAPVLPEHSPTSGVPDTNAGALDAATSFATSFYDAMFNRPQYVGIIDSAAAPGTASALVRAVDPHFAPGASAVSGDTVTATATVHANKLVSLSPSTTKPSTASVDTWVNVNYSVNSSPQESLWITAPYTLTWTGGQWRISSIPAATNGPTPEELHGASTPSGFSALPGA